LIRVGTFGILEVMTVFVDPSIHRMTVEEYEQFVAATPTRRPTATS
jgi:hypothetical protein